MKAKPILINKLKNVLVKRFGFSDLDFLIAPEIVDDDFSWTIAQLAGKPDVKRIIEIGSSSGAGSTQSFIRAISGREDVHEVELYCMELSSSRYAALKKSAKKFKFVKCFNLSSVSTKEFPSVEDVTNFYNSRKTNLNKVPLEEVLRWRAQDIQFVSNSGKDINGIVAIKQANQIDQFDLCLIDGSEFTGLSELSHLLGAKYILLDDTESYKCREAFESLERNNNYELIKHDPRLRNGFALFQLKKIA